MDRSTKEKLTSIILGGDGSADANYPKYRSGWDLTTFFSDAGLPQYRHDGETWRRGFVRDTLCELSDDEITRVIQRLCLRREYTTTEQWERAVHLVNEVLEREGLRAVTSPSGRQVAIENIDEPLAIAEAPAESEEITASATPLTNNNVMVVHGRNTAVRDATFVLLHAVGLQPIEWNDAVARAGGGSPYTGHVVKAAIEQAGAVVILLTPDDLAKLNDAFLQPGDGPDERTLTGQARPNVILELGMALMANETKTIVVEFGKTRIITDILGRNTIRFVDNPQTRHAILQRLEDAGCTLKRGAGDYWMTAGEFAAALSKLGAIAQEGKAVEAPVQHQSGGERSVNIQGGRDVTARFGDDK